MKPEMPSFFATEHKKLHSELKSIIRSGGKVAQKAEFLADVLYEHFLKEEEFALPPLGLLVDIIKGRIIPDIEDVISLTEKLEQDYLEMLKEHREIVTASEELIEAAKYEGNAFAEKYGNDLILHSYREEYIFYPASILIGKYLKCLSKKQS